MDFRPLGRSHSRSFGIHLKRLQDAIYVARAVDAPVYILWYRQAPNQIVRHLKSPTVDVVTATRRRDALVRLVWALTTPAAATAAAAGRAIPLLRRRIEALDERIATGSAPSAATRAELRVDRALLRAVRKCEPVSRSPGKHLRWVMAHDPITVRLPDDLEAEASTQAARRGIDLASPIVTLHVREPGWRPLEDDPRSCDVQTYRLAVAELVERGFQVVRIGDGTMTPLDWPGVFDIATDAARTDLLELWSMLHSTYFFGSESGPLELAKLIGVPSLLVNLKTVQSGFPLHRSDLFIMKRLFSIADARVLTLREQLAFKRRDLRLAGGVRYVDNTPEELRTAVLELLEGEQLRSPETAEQEEFRRLASTKVQGKPGRYLGEGRIARFFVERYLDRSEAPTAGSGEDEAAGVRPAG